MNAASFLFGLAIISVVHSVQGGSERIIFTKLRKGFHLVPVVLNKRFTIDCSVNNNHMKISLYRKLSNGKKEMVKVDGQIVKQKDSAFDLVIRSYFESTDYYCHGELYGTAYEKDVKVVIIATTQELSPVPEIFPGLSIVRVGDTVKIECRCKGQLSVIKWFKAGESVVAKNQKINIHNYFNIRTRESTSMLSVENVDQNDTGVYRCQATSKLHPGYSSFIDSKVEIKEDDERVYWLANSENYSVVAQIDSSIILDCSLSNAELPVAFYRLGSLGLLFRILPLRKKYDIGMQKLLIRNASLNDMGLYICKARGIINKKISLFVAPETNNICDIFKPKGMQTLCESSKDQFKEYIKRLLR